MIGTDKRLAELQALEVLTQSDIKERLMLEYGMGEDEADEFFKEFARSYAPINWQ